MAARQLHRRGGDLDGTTTQNIAQLLNSGGRGGAGDGRVDVDEID